MNTPLWITEPIRVEMGVDCLRLYVGNTLNHTMSKARFGTSIPKDCTDVTILGCIQLYGSGNRIVPLETIRFDKSTKHALRTFRVCYGDVSDGLTLHQEFSVFYGDAYRKRYVDEGDAASIYISRYITE